MKEVTTNLKLASLKRALAWCLAICMCLTLVQVDVFASNNSTDASIVATSANATNANANTCSHKYVYGKVTKKATTKADGKIKKKCSKCGKTVTDKIKKANQITVAPRVKYTGKKVKPTVTVKNSKGLKIDAKNYTVTYKNNTKIGLATVTVKFKKSCKKYTGTLTTTFKIVPTTTKITKVTAGKKALTVKWAKKTKNIDGFEIRYSTSKKFTASKTKVVKVKSTKKTSTTIKKLAAKKKYYVQLRTYKIVKGKKYVSAWNKTKAKTTK